MIFAAKQIAEGNRSIEDIAKLPEVGVSERTLYHWKQEPLFQAKIAQYREEFAREVFGGGIGNARGRQKYRNTQAIAVQHVQQQRRVLAENDPDLAAHGGRSGLIVATHDSRVTRRSRCDACQGVGLLHGGDCPHCGGTGTREVIERSAEYGFDELIPNYMAMIMRDSMEEEERYYHPERAAGGARALARVNVTLSLAEQLERIPDWELRKLIAEYEAELKVSEAQVIEAAPEPEEKDGPELIEVAPPPEEAPEFKRGPMNGKANGFGCRGSRDRSE
jgi:hypothetical protein